MTEHQILLSIRKNKCSIGYLELLSQNLTEDFPDPQADKLLLRHMISEGYISGELCAYGTLRLEPKGISYLNSLEQKTQEKQDRTQTESNENRAQIKHDWRIALFQSLVSALTAVEFWRILFSTLDFVKHLLS